MKRHALLLSTLVLFWGMFTTAVFAQQEEDPIRLSLSRDFGSSLGGRISGTFSYRVNAPDDIVRVEFYMDDDIIGEDGEAPFRLQFQTGNYPPAPHTLYVIGYTADGTARRSNSIGREFQTRSDSNRSLLYVLLPILLLTFGGRYLIGKFTSRGQSAADQKLNGLMGGTICPHCDRPYPIHWWSPQVLGTRYDRCPHCHKWGVVRRQPPDVLRAAAEETAENNTPPPNADDDLKRRLDDSRFE